MNRFPGSGFQIYYCAIVWLKCGTATQEVDLAFNPISTINTCCPARSYYLTSLGPHSLFCKNEKILSVLTHRDFSWELSDNVKKKSSWSKKKIKTVSFPFCWAPSAIRVTPDAPSDSSQSSELCFLQSHLSFCLDCLSDGKQRMKMILPLVRKEEINRQKKESLKPW